MLSTLTGDDLFVYVMMLRQVDPRLVILLEGPEDCGIVDPHLDDSVAQTISGYGKVSVLRAAHLLHVAGVSDVLPVVDSDLDRVTGNASGYPSNVHNSQYHDLLADVFFTCPELLDRLVANFADRDTYRQFRVTSKTPLAELTLEIAGQVGLLRYCSVQHGLELAMRKFPVEILLSAQDRGILTLQLATVAVRRSTTAATISGVQSILVGEMASAPDLRTLASGHDLLAVLAAYMRTRWGGRGGTDVLARAFRSGIDCSCWTLTSLYRAARDWAATRGVTIWTCLPEAA